MAQSNTKRLLTLAAFTLLAATAIGCGPAVHNITIRSSASVAPDPASATIVVIQPSTRYGSVSILDAQGQLLGMIHDRSSTVVHVPPGSVRLYVVPERQGSWGDRVEGTVDAGHVYYATISMRWGGLNFLALNPRSRDDRWSHLSEYLENAPLVEMDPARVETARTELGDTRPFLAEIDRRVDALDAEHQEEHLIRAEDGQ